MLRSLKNLLPTKGWRQIYAAGVGIPANGNHLVDAGLPYRDYGSLNWHECYFNGLVLYKNKFLFVGDLIHEETGYLLGQNIFAHKGFEFGLLSSSEIENLKKRMKEILPDIPIKNFYQGNYSEEHNLQDVNISSEKSIRTLVDHYIIGED